MENWRIEALQGVGTVELSLDNSKRVFVFLGSNGVGKTKTLETLLFALLANNPVYCKHRIQLNKENLWFSNILKNSAQAFSMPHGYFDFNQQHVGDRAYAVAYLGAGNRSAIEKAGHQTPNLGTFDNRQKVYFGQIADAMRYKNDHYSLTNLGMSENIHQWFVSRAQSVNPYQKNEDNRKVEIDSVLELLNAVDDRIDQRILRVDGNGQVFLMVEGQEREISELSSGFTSLLKMIQSIVSAYAAFTNEINLRHVRGVVLIDEIESHLHAGWQSKIVPKLKKLLPNTTFYITTHSPLVLSQLEEGEAYLLRRESDGVVRSSIISSPSNRLLSDVISIDLNQLKSDSMVLGSQNDAKKQLIEFLTQQEAKHGL